MNKLKNAMNRASMPDTGLMGTTGRDIQATSKTEAGGWDALGTNLAKGTYLRIEEDDMAAWLYLMPPDRGQIYTKNELITYLERSGVVKGYHSSNLSAMVKKKIYEREILVAKGAKCVEGKDGYFEYLFSPEEYGIPKIREDGTVDYTNVSALQNVSKGDKVAVYHYAVQGTDGYTVRGKEMKVKPSRDLPPMRGKGILRENNVYYAQSDGKIEAKNGKIDIQNVHEIMGDVDMIIGKIEFFGDVIIYGNVESGVMIRAGRNIEVHGTTGNATLFAGGDVVLSRGIQGGGKISARGNVFADFIENTTVDAGGMVQANTILNAQIYAKDKVITTGKKGVIIGGYTHGLKGIEVMAAGNDAEVKTILHCGYEPEAYLQLVDVRQRERAVKEKISDLVETMTEALREKRMRGASTSATTEAKLAEWNKLKDQYFEELDKISSDRETLEEIMAESKGASIKIDGNLYRNVMICINAEQMVIARGTCFMQYAANKGIIEGTVIVHN
ncbi:MAG: FapA family protein [Eubacterium sp.]|nr:FapA family protein [Eubacterium sp.]